MWHCLRWTMQRRYWRRNATKFLAEKRRTQRWKRRPTKWRNAPPIWSTSNNCKKISKKRNRKVNSTPCSTGKQLNTSTISNQILTLLVIIRYCRNRTIAIDCLNNFTQALEPCLDAKELEGQKTFVKIFNNLLSFICYKDGDQIALFIAEKGPECFSDKKDQLLDCFNSTFFKYIPSEAEAAQRKLVPTTLPQLVMGVEQCKWVNLKHSNVGSSSAVWKPALIHYVFSLGLFSDMDALQVCVVKHLEKCEESTPANLVESMFKFVRNETVCGDIAPVSYTHSNKCAQNRLYRKSNRLIWPFNVHSTESETNQRCSQYNVINCARRPIGAVRIAVPSLISPRSARY